MRPLALLPVLTAAVALAHGGASARQAAEPRVRTEADTSLATVGDRITLTLAVEHAPDQRVLWPDSLDMAPFEVLGAERVEPSPDGPRGRSALRLTLTTFELGELEIPSVRIGVASPDGTIDTLASSPWGVTVASVGLDEEGDIREIRGPLAIALDWFLLLPWALLALLLLVAFVVWWRRRRRREGPPAPPPPEPRRPAHEVALEALARLEASDLLERGAVKEYHVKVSDIVRTYVEDLYRVPALEMTTAEVLLGLSRVGVHGGPLDHLRAFLERCDLVKFAKLRPPEDASRQILAVARAIVEETRPRVGEAGVAAATASGGTGARGRATDVEDAPPTRGAGGPATDVAGSSRPAGLEGP